MAGASNGHTDPDGHGWCVAWMAEDGETVRRTYGTHGITWAEAARMADEKGRRYARLGGSWEVLEIEQAEEGA